MISSQNLLLITIILFSCSKTPKHPELARFIQNEFETHPKMNIQDLYKFLYQAEFGPNHILDNPVAAKEYLALEAASKSNNNIPLKESCSADGSLLRINLQTFKEKNLSLDTLFLCLEESARRIHGNETHFKETWKHVGELIDELSIPIPLESYKEFTKMIRGKNYLPVHHSREYTIEYHPSYRVVVKSVFEKYFPNVK